MIIAIVALLASCAVTFLYVKGIRLSVAEGSVTEDERKSFPVFMALLLGVLINSLAYVFVGIDSIVLVLLIPAVAWAVLRILRDKILRQTLD